MLVRAYDPMQFVDYLELMFAHQDGELLRILKLDCILQLTLSLELLGFNTNFELTTTYRMLTFIA